MGAFLAMLVTLTAISGLAGHRAAAWFAAGIIAATIATLFDDWRTFRRKDRP